MSASCRIRRNDLKTNRLIEKVAKAYHRMKLKDEPVNFFSTAENRGNCLVCMPGNLQHMLHAASKLPDIAAIFPNRMIKVMVTSNIDHRSHEFIKKFSHDKPAANDITAFSLPKKPFIDKLIGNGLAICVDLDFENNFFNSCVCALTQAPLRIATCKGLGLPYYNLQIDIGSPEKITADTYIDFIKVLYNFRDKGEKVAPVET
jgi:hypothetical protein